MTADQHELPPPQPPTILSLLGKAIRNRIVSGLLVALPLLITVWIVLWLYSAMRRLVIDPIAHLLLDAFGKDLVEKPLHPATPAWFREHLQRDHAVTPAEYVAPVVALIVVIILLYLLGMFFQSRLHRAVDWVLLRVPGVKVIFKAVRDIFNAIQPAPGTETRYKRVVLVKFPHADMRVPAFVTASIRDNTTGKKILCVYVPTTPVPTSGYMLLVPEEEVTNLEWNLDQTLQAIVSGGLSVPKRVDYYPVLPVAAEGETAKDSPGAASDSESS